MSRVLLVVILGVLLLLPAAADAAGSSDVVISQVYGGGGNAGATFRNDYVELSQRRVHFHRRPGGLDSAVRHRRRRDVASNRACGNDRSGPLLPGPLASNADVGAALPTPDATGTSATSARRAGRSRSFPARPRSRVAPRPGAVRGSSRTSSATAMRAISRAPVPLRRFPTPRPRFARRAVALTQTTTRPTSRRPRPRHGTRLLQHTCVRARLPLDRAAP